MPALQHPAVALGWRRVRLLRERLLGLHAQQAEAEAQAAADHDASLLPEISGGYPVGPLRGLAVGTVPPAWLDAVSFSGVPLANAGPWRWGVELRPGSEAVPVRAGGTVLLPPPERLQACNALELKPLRLAVAAACGCRLQAAPGVHLFLWEALAILVSCRELPLGGFLSGPRPGSRGAIELEPGGIQVMRW